MLVKDGIDLHHFHRNHGFRVGNHFHGEMRLAIGGAAADRRAHPGGIGGINEVHVQADGNAGRVVHGLFQGLRQHVAQAALIDIAHSEDVNAGFLYDFAFLGIQVARANDHDVAGLGFGLEPA